MSVQDDFNARMKDAMKRKDSRELGVLRMVKTRFQVKLAEKGGSDSLSDEQALEVISAYCKQLQKALPEYEKGGERGAEKVAELRYELEYLSQFLPQLLDEAATEALVRETVASLGLNAPNQVGRLMGAIMASHKGQVDANLVRQLAGKVLGQP